MTTETSNDSPAAGVALTELFDCYGDPELLPAAEAHRRIETAVRSVTEIHRRPLRDALNRVLAEDVISPLDVPGFTNSAMDGYAIAGQSLPAEETPFSVLGTAWAGKPLNIEVGPGQAARIMTGAVMPAGTDTVVMQEQVRQDPQDEQRIVIGPGHAPGQNVRQAGEDLRQGATVLRRGQRLMPAELGLLASLGIGEVPVYRPVRVAMFSTGDELRSIGEPLEPGAVYDSNRYTLFAMLTRLGVEIEDLGVVRDEPSAIQAAFEKASMQADVIVTSGGASAGDADLVSDTLRRLGQVGFWRIAIRPGRPLAFGKLGGSFLFGLPGNPVAVMVTFYQFVQPALQLLMGERPVRTNPMVRASAAHRFRKKPGRVEYYRAVLERDETGKLIVSQSGKSGSALLHTMSDANCFVVLPDEADSVEAGALVDVQPFFGLV